MNMKKKMRQMLALLLVVALMASSVRLDGVAAESLVSEETIEQIGASEETTEQIGASEETKEQIEASEAEELQENVKTEKEILMSDGTDNDDDNQNDIQETESDSDETTESEVQEGTQLETIETEHQEEIQTGTATSESQEELRTETTEKEVPEELQTESTDKDLQEEIAENVYMMQLNGEEEPLENVVDNEREFALQDGNTDITSGKFGAVLALVTLPEEADGIHNEDYVKILNPRITGADGDANAYFKNLHIIAVNKEENTTIQYQLVGDVKAETPIATYTVTMAAGGKSDTATFAIVEKGIESLKISGIPSVVSSEKKVSIRPILEINGDPTGKDRTTTPQNKKMTWEIVSVEGAAAPSSLKINRQNGAITVNAGDNGAFRIKATTTDGRYTDAGGNPISVTSEIVEVVSDNDQKLDSLADCAIVLVDNSDPAKAQLLNQNGKTADMNSLDGTKAYVKIQKADGSFVNAENYVIKANNKAFRIGADTSVACVLTKPIASGKTLTITLTATLVNGKKEQPLKGKIIVQNAPAGEQDLSLALGVSGAGRSELKDDGKTLEFSGSASTLIKMELMRNGNSVGSPASYNLKFRNLKKVYEAISKDSIVVYATLRTASGTVTLTDCSTGKKTTYEVKNVEKTAAVGKSPTIKQRTNPASNTGPDYVITAKGKAVTDYTHVRVELLPVDYIKSCKTRSAQGKYRAFASALGLDPYGSDKSFGVYEVEPEDNTFRIPFVKAEQPAKGSYKLQMTVGKMTGSQFVATAVPVIVTTKVSGNRAEPEKTPQEQPPSGIEDVKVLVAYFSATNITKGVAKKLSNGIDADPYEIVPAVPYTSADLNYNNSGSRANKEMNDPNARPAITGSVGNMEQYNIVFIGYPIWWGQAPRIISTFLESYDFSEKTIIPFCTSHSSGIGSSATNLQPLTKDALWLTGRRFSGSESQNAIMEWVRGLGLNLGEHTMAGDISFNFETKTVLLNSGYEMPIYGIGTYSLTGDTCVESVTTALNSGVRLIDTAYMYHNEESVGKAVRNSGIPREEIFVITKLYPNQFSNPEAAIEEALTKLDIGYIDMMLLHHPGAGDVEAYLAMEKAVADGKIRSLGLSNWYVEELEEFLPQINIMPALVQNEIHPYYQENDVIPYIHNLGIVVQGWYPLGGRGYTAQLLGNEVISEIAAAHGKSSAQIILRWNLQKGVVVIPGSSNPDHIQENTELFDFELTEGEMAKINALDRNEKHDWY